MHNAARDNKQTQLLVAHARHSRPGGFSRLHVHPRPFPHAGPSFQDIRQDLAQGDLARAQVLLAMGSQRPGMLGRLGAEGFLLCLNYLSNAGIPTRRDLRATGGM